jgi:hypothetical protein
VISPDVNVLIYAFRDDSMRHAEYRDWLKSVRDGQSAYAICPQVLAAVVRIVTNPRIHKRPSHLENVLFFCDALLAPGHCQIISPGARHWGIFRDLCRKGQATGNLVPDAWFAALAIECGCEWITTDRDYARFPGLRWRTPF